MKKYLIFNESMYILRNNYRSIDVRAAIGKKKDAKEWICIFSRIKLTAENKPQVEEIYRTCSDCIILVECTQQFLSDRTIIGEYETAKLTHMKSLLEKRGHNVYAILICSEMFDNNPTFYTNIISKHNTEVYFFFEEDLKEIELSKPTTISELLHYSRNSKFI